jgi:hypothetical protein
MAAAAGEHARAAMWAAGVVVTLGLATVICVAGGDWPASAVYAVGVVVWVRIFWKNWRRRKRNRSLAALGHKARARLAALLRSMPKPGPVLRPVPQGARA